MGLTVTKANFHFSYTDEPHATRRKQILQAHPEVKSLFGVDPSLKYVVAAQVLTQIAIAYAVRSAPWPLVILLAYAAGGTFNHSLTLAVHEVSHNTAYGSHRPMANRLFGMLANLPLFVPMSVTFKKYHLEHHRYLGEHEVDTDVPTEWEARTFCTTGLKALWLLLQPVFYGFRPMVLYNKAITDLELVNAAVQIAFDLAVLYFWGVKSALYLFLGTALGLGIHPCSGHFISDHYVFSDDHETSSYYGPINWVTYNVGYHVEHHDFPSVPGRRLPEVRRMAPEFYTDLPDHSEGWLAMMWRFVVDPDVGLRSRVKRQQGQAKAYYGHYSCALHRAVFGGVGNAATAAKGAGGKRE